MTARRHDDPEDLDVARMRTHNGVTITPRGVRLSGRQVLPMLVVVAASAAFIAWMYFNAASIVDAEAVRVHGAIDTREHEVMLRAIKATEAAIREQTWVLLQSESERARLRQRWLMPRSIRDRFLDRDTAEEP